MLLLFCSAKTFDGYKPEEVRAIILSRLEDTSVLSETAITAAINAVGAISLDA